MEIETAPRYIQRAYARLMDLRERFDEDIRKPWCKEDVFMVEHAVDKIHELQKTLLQYWKVTGEETHLKGGIDNPNHVLEVQSYTLNLTNPEVTVKCSVCHQEFTRPATEEETKEINEQWEDTHSLHTLCHKIKNELDGVDDSVAQMDILDKYVEKYPDAVWSVRVDDSYHASSDIYIISHKEPKQFWGFTCIYIGQCDGGYAEFFLYPSHLIHFKDTLNKIDNLVQEAR